MGRRSCGYPKKLLERLGCVTMNTETLQAIGVGTGLKKLLSLFLLKSGSCNCDQHVEVMNLEGPQWCLTNLETVVDWLQESAKERKLPFIRVLAKKLVKRAINNSLKKYKSLGLPL